MRPSILGTHKFDLVVMPRHDRPKFKRNIAITETALNLINDDYLLKVKNEVLNYLKAEHKSIDERKIVLGLLLGGDTKSFSIPKEALSVIIQGLNKFVTRHNAELLLSTSRRTSKENEDLVKSTFSGNEHCKFLIIANEKNIPEAVGGILALSKIVLVSPESISMISEAVSSKKYVVVFDLKGLSRKHRDFLSRLSAKKYIYLTAPHNLGNTLEDILENKPAINIIDDKSAIREKLDRIL
jgi:mitochondrial fission protein ELM1